MLVSMTGWLNKIIYSNRTDLSWNEYVENIPALGLLAERLRIEFFNPIIIIICKFIFCFAILCFLLSHVPAVIFLWIFGAGLCVGMVFLVQVRLYNFIGERLKESVSRIGQIGNSAKTNFYFLKFSKIETNILSALEKNLSVYGYTRSLQTVCSISTRYITEIIGLVFVFIFS